MNLVLLVSCGLVHCISTNIFQKDHSFNPAFLSTSIVGACTGILSFALFFLSRTRQEKETHLVLNQEETSASSQKMLFEKALEDRGQDALHSEFRRDFSGLWVFMDYTPVCTASLKHFLEEDPIWGALCLLISFLPGMAWHSRKDLVSTDKNWSLIFCCILSG